MNVLPAGIKAPAKFNTSKLVVWRLEKEAHLGSWNQGVGAFLVGGRWNPVNKHAIYTSLDPATTILELAVHVGFSALDSMNRWLLEIEILDPADVHVLDPETVPNPRWLTSGSPTPAQQQFGAQLLDQHPYVVLPSAVSEKSWNLIINPILGKGRFREISRTKFGLDPRLARCAKVSVPPD